MNLKYIAFDNKNIPFCSDLASSPFFKKVVKKAICQNGVQDCRISPNSLLLTIQGSCVTIDKDTSFKTIYELLSKSQASNLSLQRINSTSTKYNINPNKISDLCKKLWNNAAFRPFEKNVLYCFIMGSYLDKQDKWLRNLVPHPMCFACENSWHGKTHGSKK